MKTSEEYEKLIQSLQQSNVLLKSQIEAHLSDIQYIKEKINFISDDPDYEDIVKTLLKVEWEALAIENNIQAQTILLPKIQIEPSERETIPAPNISLEESNQVLESDEAYLSEVLTDGNKPTMSKLQDVYLQEALKEIQEVDSGHLFIENFEQLDEMFINLSYTLNYAKRFQEATLPSKEKFRNHFNDSFVLYKPKEVVSGDFYWLCDLDEDKSIVAVMDCTGHGVPGAFMTLLAYDLLNEIIHIQKVTEVDKILRMMHIGVRKSLRQHETQNRDGMDVAICLIDRRNKKIEYAGAHNPLLFVQAQKHELIKADKFAVGGYEKEGNRQFIKKIIPLDKLEGACLYLFTDGYQDQLGGPNDRRFMASRLQRILYEMHHKPMSKQKKILEKVIDFWMKGKKQMDDMLIIGIKL